jgi:hypothetical protein
MPEIPQSVLMLSDDALIWSMKASLPQRIADAIEHKSEKTEKAKKILRKQAEYAPGIPSKFTKDLPRLSEPQPMRLAIQSHKAKKAGQHYDIRIVDDKTGKAYSWAARNLPVNPGDKTLAVLQPTHTAEYSTWEGKIESGYGAGDVSLFSQDKIEVIKAEPTKITFNVYKTNGDTERYAMINTGGDQWLFHNVTPTRTTRPELPMEKPHYKNIPPQVLDPNKVNEIWAPKIDGALNVFLLKPDKPIETYSYRPSARGTNKLIDHTFRLGLHKTFVPTAFKGKTVVLGEVFARDRETGKVLPSTDTSARLLSNVWRSRELQQKAPLDNVVFNVLRYNGRDVSKKPYEEKLKILKEITTAVPQLKMPPLHTTADSKAELMKEVKSGTHPLTEEGVVVYKLNEDTPIKSKLQQDYDVYIRGAFPGEGKYRGRAAGGFTYSFKPSGPITGRVGSGLSDTMRKELWEQPEKYKGSVARIFAQQQLPSGALRMPVFKDIRSEKFASLMGGKADKKKPSDFNPKSIAQGMKVEREHTTNKATQKEIAMDHLTEDPKYYDKLKKMEKKAYPEAVNPVTTYPISSTELHEIGKTQGEDAFPDPNVQVRQENPNTIRPGTVRVRETRRFLRKKADASAASPQTTGGSELYMSETPRTQNFYQDTSAYRITEHTPDTPSSSTVATTATQNIKGRKVKINVRTR